MDVTASQIQTNRILHFHQITLGSGLAAVNALLSSFIFSRWHEYANAVLLIETTSSR